LGQEAKKTAIEKFSVERFHYDWQKIINLIMTK
jgi:hypothetical protein